jgi:AraC-like DNA-binding protein
VSVTPIAPFGFRQIKCGIERFSGYSLPRHRHFQPYATVVLEGCFEQAGYAGRIRATAGDILIHPALDCHSNNVVSASVRLVRLNWSDHSGNGAFHRLGDIDEIARVAEKDPQDAAFLLEACLATSLCEPAGRGNDWPDALAQALRHNPSFEIGEWAQENDLALETVSRGFKMAYGVPPTIFRAELRARSAWLRITRGSEPLCAVAARSGFSDQSHMTRWISRISGSPPSVWRDRQRGKQGERETAGFLGS